VPPSRKPLLSRTDDWAAAPAGAVLFEGDGNVPDRRLGYGAARLARTGL